MFSNDFSINKYFQECNESFEWFVKKVFQYFVELFSMVFQWFSLAILFEFVKLFKKFFSYIFVDFFRKHVCRFFTHFPVFSGKFRVNNNNSRGVKYSCFLKNFCVFSTKNKVLQQFAFCHFWEILWSFFLKKNNGKNVFLNNTFCQIFFIFTTNSNNTKMNNTKIVNQSKKVKIEWISVKMKWSSSRLKREKKREKIQKHIFSQKWMRNYH